MIVQLDRRTFLQLTIGAAALSASPAWATDALVLGEFLLEPTGAVVDGDTVKVVGLDRTLRLIGIDTEESFKSKDDERAARKDFAAYAADKQGDSAFPAKYATPMGEVATVWAKDWFRGVTRVRLEYDDPIRKVGYYSRHVVHVFALKKGRWHHYNVASVEAGMTPYFPKYGYSDRFHDAFVAAQTKARAAKLGVWSPDTDHYPDYDTRLTWWNRRAEAIRHFRTTHAGNPAYVELGLESSWPTLMAAIGERKIVFGSVSSQPPPEGRPYRRFMSHRSFDDFAIVSFTPGEVETTGIEAHQGEYAYVEGTVTQYKGRPQFQANGVVRVWTEP